MSPNDLSRMETAALLQEAEKLRDDVSEKAQKLCVIFETLQRRGRQQGISRFASFSLRNLRASAVIVRSADTIKLGAFESELETQKADQERRELMIKKQEERAKTRTQRLREANAVKIQSLGGGVEDNGD